MQRLTKKILSWDMSPSPQCTQLAPTATQTLPGDLMHILMHALQGALFLSHLHIHTQYTKCKQGSLKLLKSAYYLFILDCSSTKTQETENSPNSWPIYFVLYLVPTNSYLNFQSFLAQYSYFYVLGQVIPDTLIHRFWEEKKSLWRAENMLTRLKNHLSNFALPLLVKK